MNTENQRKRWRRWLALLLALISFDKIVAVLMSLSLTAAVAAPLAVSAFEARSLEERDLVSAIQTSAGEVA